MFTPTFNVSKDLEAKNEIKTNFEKARAETVRGACIDLSKRFGIVASVYPILTAIYLIILGQ